MEREARRETPTTAEQVGEVNAVAFVVVLAHIVSPTLLRIGEDAVGFDDEFELLFVSALSGKNRMMSL